MTKPKNKQTDKDKTVLIAVIYTLTLVAIGLIITLVTQGSDPTSNQSKEVAEQTTKPNSTKPGALETPVPPPNNVTTPTPTPDTGGVTQTPIKGVAESPKAKPEPDKDKETKKDTPKKDSENKTEITETVQTTLGFSLIKTPDKYKYSFILQNGSKTPVTLTIPSGKKTALIYKILASDNTVVLKGGASMVTNQTTTIDKERSEILYLDISTDIATLQKGVYTLEVSPVYATYEDVTASLQFMVD